MTDWERQGVTHTARSPHCRLGDVAVSAVTMGDGFWRPRMRTNAEESLPALLRLLEDHGVVDNFRRLSGRKQVERRGLLWTDSDLAKAIEAAAFVLQSNGSPALRYELEAIVDDVIAAQGDDGYLNTWFADDRAGGRFTRLGSDHELYCAGHLIQAAIAHYRATGKPAFLDAVCRYADYLADTFGPGKHEGFDGHPEVEMALVELYRTTGKAAYLELARFMLEQQQFTAKQTLEGHAVRAGYLCAGAADAYAETGDPAALAALERLWSDLLAGKLYVTGGVGARHGGEALGLPYELPNLRAYAETCAAIALIYWGWRMLAISANAEFADVLERALYNGFLSGVSLSGTEYFYVNPLECLDGYQRQAWFECTCCPTNVVRMIASVPGYLFSSSPDGLWVHLYDTCHLDARHGLTGACGKAGLEMRTRYPWEGTVELTLRPREPAEFTLHLRIPGWCERATVQVNDGSARSVRMPGPYLPLRRRWAPGDTVKLDLDMPVVALEADPRARENRGCVALQRGPVVYCFESVDHPGSELLDLKLRLGPRREGYGLVAEEAPGLLGGVTVLRGKGLAPPQGQPRGPLYRPRGTKVVTGDREIAVTAIPYYAWANRGPSQMLVWAPRG